MEIANVSDRTIEACTTFLNIHEDSAQFLINPDNYIVGGLNLIKLECETAAAMWVGFRFHHLVA